MKCVTAANNNNNNKRYIGWMLVNIYSSHMTGYRQTNISINISIFFTLTLFRGIANRAHYLMLGKHLHRKKAWIKPNKIIIVHGHTRIYKHLTRTRSVEAALNICYIFSSSFIHAERFPLRSLIHRQICRLITLLNGISEKMRYVQRM